MSKYQPLTERLTAHAGPQWRATFAEIEKVLGFPLPKGARTGQVWWRNTGAQPHQRAWTGAGWEVAEVTGGAVTFRRKSAAPTPEPVRSAQPPAAADEPAILSRLEVTPKWSLALVATGLTIAAGLSVFAIRGWMRRRDG